MSLALVRRLPSSFVRRSVPGSVRSVRGSVLRSTFFVPFFVLSSSFLVLHGCSSDDSPTAPSDPSVGLNLPFSATDLVVGTGAEALLGRSVTVQYTGWLYHPNAAQNRGPQIDPGGTFGPFVLGTTVIQGWTQGLQGMRVGGSRRLVIPPALGYGSAGRAPAVPGNATLLFEVTLVSVQ